VQRPGAIPEINLTGRAELTGDASVMGAHHFGMHPDGVHIYMGSKEGNTFIINRNSMSIVGIVESGAGSGHTTFDASANVAIETNHTDTFMTLIDTNNHIKLGDIELCLLIQMDILSRAHMTGILERTGVLAVICNNTTML
jgi:hypothetical protein